MGSLGFRFEDLGLGVRSLGRRAFAALRCMVEELESSGFSGASGFGLTAPEEPRV